MINYDDSRRDISIDTIPGLRTQSRLIIREPQIQDSGNYTCSASNTEPASIYVFVSKGKHTTTHTLHCIRRYNVSWHCMYTGHQCTSASQQSTCIILCWYMYDFDCIYSLTILLCILRKQWIVKRGLGKRVSEWMCGFRIHVVLLQQWTYRPNHKCYFTIFTMVWWCREDIAFLYGMTTPTTMTIIKSFCPWACVWRLLSGTALANNGNNHTHPTHTCTELNVFA